MDISALPFNRLIGVERSSLDGALLALPDHERYTNHLGTVHASALLALAEATSGEYLVGALGGIGFGVLPVVRRVDAKFRRPATGAVHSKLGSLGDSHGVFVAALRAKGRALIVVPVEVFDAKGVHALSAAVEWFVARRIEGPSV